MTRRIVGVLLLLLPVAIAGEQAWAQSVEPSVEASSMPVQTDGRLHGAVVDAAGEPLAGVLVSAMGMTTVFAVTGEDGRFMFRGLPVGPYLVRAHLEDFAPARAREVEVTGSTRAVSNFELKPHAAADKTERPAMLAAGLRSPELVFDRTADEGPGTGEDKERAWRLRHLRRSILKDAEIGVVLAGGGDTLSGEAWSSFGRTVANAPARLAAALFSDPAVSAEVNFLTATSFSRPQDLFSSAAGLPRGVAYVALDVPDEAGTWAVQGALTQGDLASWILAGSYASQREGAHQFKIGMSYSMQRYTGGNTDALASIGDGSRNSGLVSGVGRWALGSVAEVEYGTRFAVYDYLTSSRGLLSPHAGVSVSPFRGDSLEIRAAVSRSSVAPGASEFLPPSSGLLLPPERTFSPAGSGGGFVPERVNHVEVGVDRKMLGSVVVGVRAFRQSVEDQAVTLFGASVPGADATIGHYYVGSAGDFDAQGVGVSVSRSLLAGLTGSVDYTVTDATWIRRAEVTPILAVALARPDEERIHDITTAVEGAVAATATRIFFVYKLNTGLALPDDGEMSRLGRRFDLRVNQALPFLDFTSAEWEIIVAVRNIFHSRTNAPSVFDELLVVQPPKQIVGGVTVQF